MPGEKREKQEHQQLKNQRKRQKENFHSFRITLYECQNGVGMPPTARHNSGLQGGPDREGGGAIGGVCFYFFFWSMGAGGHPTIGRAFVTCRFCWRCRPKIQFHAA